MENTLAIKIHRGTQQIGGCVTEISYGSSRIIIDFGSELPNTLKEPEDLTIPGLTMDDQEGDTISSTYPRYKAVFYTHHHGDHMGKFKTIRRDIPQYMGATARRIMITISKWINDQEALQILNDDNIIHEVEENKPINIGDGDIIVTPFSVDHSAYDSYMYLIEAGGKRILHTGDFRDHGYRGKALIPMLKHYVCENGRRPIDILIIEGTMMSRPGEQVMGESAMKRQIKNLLMQRRYAFVICSSTNLDSLASFCQGARELGIPVICNPYQKEIFQIYRDTAGQKSDLYRFDNVYAFGDDHNLRLYKGVSQDEYIRDRGFLMLVKADAHYEKRMEMFKDLDPVLIYSMWDGYLNPHGTSYNKELAEMVHRWNGIILHTSGHATPSTIAKVIETVRPQEAIIPIHTERREEFSKLDISKELLSKLCFLEDGIWDVRR